MRDAFRVYISGDDGRWKLLSTNNSDRDLPPDDDYLDEFDPFDTLDAPDRPARAGTAVPPQRSV